MSMPAVTSWCWDMAGVLLPLWVRFGPTIFYMCHRRLRAEHNLGLLIPFEPVCRTCEILRNYGYVLRAVFPTEVLGAGIYSSVVFGGSMVLANAVYALYMPLMRPYRGVWSGR